MAARDGEVSSEEIQVIEKNPEPSQGKTVISDKDITSDIISKTIQSQLAAILPNMVHQTLAQTTLEGAKSSSQTLNTSSTASPWLAAGSKQGSNEALSLWSAAGSTQGLNDDHADISDLPSKKAKWSGVNEDYNDDLTIPAGQWDASEELSSFLDVVFADKPLSVYDRKQITKDFPRPNVESVFTPVLDDYLSALATGAKEGDKESKKLQDQILDIVGPLSMAFRLQGKNPIIPCDLDSHPSRNVRICGELPKIPTKPFTVNRVSGFSHKFNYSKHQPSIGQSIEYQTRVSQGSGESRYHDKRPSLK